MSRPPACARVPRRAALRRAMSCAVLCLGAFLSPAPVLGQGPGLGARGGPTPFSVGLRGGWEFTNSNWILGAHARVGLPGVSFLDVQAVGDLTFASPPAFVGGSSFQERTLNTELLFRTGTLAVGGGAVFRNSFWVDFDSPRETRTGWSAVAVLGGVADPRSAFAFQIEYRYTRIEGFGLQAFTAGASVVPTRLF